MLSKMMQTSPTRRGFRAGFTIGRGINITLAFIFLILVILALVVVGSLANLHKRLIENPDRSNSTDICILFSSEKDGHFQYGRSNACEAEIYGFAIVAGIFIALLVVIVARIVMAADIWWSALVEGAVMVVVVVFAFILGVVISRGLAATCDTVLDINKEENHCDQKVPDDNGIKYYHSVNSAQASVWLIFFLSIIVSGIYGIRSFIYFYRLHMQKSPDMQPVLQRNLKESQTKPI